MTNFYFAGIGSRTASKDVLNRVKELADYLSSHNAILRSGGAKGMDMEWEKHFSNYDHRSVIFYPHQCFNKNFSGVSFRYEISDRTWAKAENIAKQFHPKWNILSPFVKRLMIRNVFQLLNVKDLKPISKCVICWTPDGANGVDIKTSIKTGGTGLAIRIANHYDIPVFNMKAMSNDEIIQELEKLL